MTPSTLPAADRMLRALLSAETNTQFTLAGSGRAVAYVRTGGDGQELWLDAGGEAVRLAAHPGERLADLRWTADDSVLVYRRAQRGREAWHLSGVRLADGARLTYVDDGSCAEFWLSPEDPGTVVFAGRAAGRWAGLLAVATDRADRPAPLAENPGFHRWLVDNRLRPRGGVALSQDGSARLFLGADLAAARPVLTLGVDEVADLAVQRFSRDDTRLFVVTSAGAPVRRLLEIAADGTARTVFAHASLDLASYPIAGDGVWFDPVSGEPDICAVMDQRPRYFPLTSAAERAVRRLTVTEAEVAVPTGRSRDDAVWLVSSAHGDGPLRHDRVRPATGDRRFVGFNRPELAGADLPPLRDLSVRAGDGWRLGGYLMRPPGAAGPLPTVVMVHGGPAAREYWRFNAEAQYLAALGYQSVHVNFRGSTGFGAAFRLAGNGEWGGRMQEDLYDAVRHGVDAGLVDPRRVAFFGASYGGYAALLAACTRPDLVRCAVAVSPPPDLASFADTPPGYWRPLAAQLRRQVLCRADGQPVDPATLDRRSPLRTVDERCAPVLIAHGARDPRVPIASVEAFVERARGLGNAVRYLRFEDEGHHVHANRNREVLYREIAAFLEVNLAHG